ncbi:MAG TPA: hypothetical protein PLD54_00940, partial [Candidatus Levybacteria bacterium]|nr:hypothetical protein [Candidatus Levybacteria bacterium]
MKGRLGYLPDDEVSITKLEELVQANRRFGYEIEYDVYILPVTAELMEELRSTGQRIAAIFSTEYLKRE